MNTIYKLTEAIQTELESNVLINTVSYGDIDDLLLDKRNVYPVAHVNLVGATLSSATANVSVSVMIMDIVDINKSKTPDAFRGNDNEHDVLNQCTVAASKLVTELKRGQLYADGFQVEGDANVEFFTDRFEHKIAGVAVTFDVILSNNIDLC
tara:strand:+ start:439 stop:894 length:456 start_codon:yes stop_codon:yes gene_type:complete